MSSKRLFLLGLDGMEPGIFEKLTSIGALPNLTKLLEAGVYSRLLTTTPPISPVAWTSMLSGCTPGKHGNRGFVSRRVGTYNTACDLYEIEEDSDGLPRYGRKKNVDTIADALSAAHKTSYIMWVPATFPPDSIQGAMMSGLGVPDLKGTFGSSTIYISDAKGKPADARYNQVDYRGKGEWIETKVVGPRNISTPIYFLPEEGKLKVSFDKSETVTEVAAGSWSDWFTIPFTTKSGRKFEGIGRLKLIKLTRSELELYLTPINYSPRNPLNEISAPTQFSRELASVVGPFGTMGFTADHTALKAQVISDETFIEYAYSAFHERLKVVRYILQNKDWDFLLVHFFVVDMLQHMFWRYTDPEHELYDPAKAATAGKIIAQGYRDLDREVGRLLHEAPRDTHVIVMSDHGFCSLRAWVNINNWLYEQGYLKLKEGTEEEYGKDTEGTFLRTFREAASSTKAAIDWSQTQAFTCGFTGVHLNVAGRDPLGCVKRGREYFQVRGRIIEGLKKIKDPKTAAPIIKKIASREEVFTGRFASTFPDIIPFFYPGYNLSRENVFGEIVPGMPVVQPNDNNWSGGHAGPYTPEDIAGIFIASGAGIKAGVKPGGTAHIWDVAPTILSLLEVPVPEYMEGRPLDIFT